MWAPDLGFAFGGPKLSFGAAVGTVNLGLVGTENPERERRLRLAGARQVLLQLSAAWHQDHGREHLSPPQTSYAQA